jgi:membrane protease YdiL (CAAX protease family)
MRSTPALARQGTAAIAWPIALPLVRVAMVGLATIGTWALLTVSGQAVGFSSVTQYSALALAPVNVACLLLLARLLRREGTSISQLAGFERARVGRDLGWGLLWLMVLYVPFALTVLGTMLVMFGADAFTSFERVFAPDVHAAGLLPQSVATVLAILTVATFAPLNAPTEELVFRGYAQGRLAHTWPAAFAVLLPAAVFGLQHALFAPTQEGAIVYVAAFFVWGLGSGLIYLRQRRLAPLIYCHIIVNLLTSLPALLVPFLAGS